MNTARNKRVTFAVISFLGACVVFYYSNNLPHSFQIQTESSIKDDLELHPIFDRWVIVKNNKLDNVHVDEMAKLLNNWRILIVSNKNTPFTSCKTTNCRTLTLGDQKKWLFPEDTSPENAAIRYAVAHKAKVLYVTDGSKPFQNLLQLHFQSNNVSMLVAVGNNSLINQYSHFGRPDIYPRGFPVGFQQSNDSNIFSYKILENWKPPAIQHVVNLELPLHTTKSKKQSQFDNGHRLDQHHRPFKAFVDDVEIFNSRSPPVLLPPGTLSIYGTTHTLYTYDSLWCLLRPVTSHPELSDIWKNLYAQRLLWEIGAVVGFFPPTNNPTVQNNVNGITKKEYIERYTRYTNKTYLKTTGTEELVLYLTKWTCPKAQTFFRCMVTLSVDLSNSGFWIKKDVSLTKSWIEFLGNSGYREPRRVKKWLDFNQQANTSVYTIVPSLHADIMDENHANAIDVSNVTHHVAQINDICRGFTKTFENHHQVMYSQSENGSKILKINKVKEFLSDILVIIVFNKPLYKQVNDLLVFYKPLYPNLVFCGYHWDKFKEWKSNFSVPVTFIEFQSLGGIFGYQCATKAMQMGYRVKGYFFTGDDVIQLWWHSFHFNKNSFWMNGGLSFPSHTWSWWKRKYGSQALGNAVRYINSTTRAETNDVITTHQTFLKNLDNNSRRRGALKGISDAAYIPERFKKDVIYYFNIFYDKETFQEIAVPVVLSGISRHKNRSDMTMFRSMNLWGSYRDNLKILYNKALETGTTFIFHPVKLLTGNGKSFFCDSYLFDLLNKTSY